MKKFFLIVLSFFLAMGMTTAFAKQSAESPEKKGFFHNVSQDMSKKASELKESSARVKTQSLRDNKAEIERRKENKRPAKEFDPESI